MIFYFTGTGNSLYAASRIAEEQGDRVFSIAKLMDLKKDVYHYELENDELLGFVFPVFAWAPPKIVLDFIERLEISSKPESGDRTEIDGKVPEGEGKPYVFSLCTCGDEEGRTSQVLGKALAKRGLDLDGAFSLRMPNNYIVGFDVDSKETEAGKLKAAELLLSEIGKSIGRRQRGIALTLPGKFPGLKTALINPMFNRFALSTKSFHVDDTCTRCRICERICPVHTITITGDEKPVWGKDCTQCLGCINRCPVRAIQMGKGTDRKGRYCHPDLDRLERQVSEWAEE